MVAVPRRPPIVRFPTTAASTGLLHIYRREAGPRPVHAARMHGHRFFDVSYFEGGVGEVRLPLETVRVETGTVLIMAPGALHDTTGAAHLGGWILEFTGDLLGPGASLGAPWLVVAGRRIELPAHVEVPPEQRAEWERRFARLAREAEGRDAGSREALRALLALLLVDLARLLPPAPRPTATGSALLNEVFTVIEDRYPEPGLSLAGIARAVGRSPSHVTAVVRAGTGMTVLEWLTDRRMAEARRRLQETDEDVAIIAERVGYRDATYFARLFSRTHGISPRTYRRRLS